MNTKLQELLAATETLLKDAEERREQVEREIRDLQVRRDDYQRQAAHSNGKPVAPVATLFANDPVAQAGAEAKYGLVKDAVLRVYVEHRKALTNARGASLLGTIGVKTPNPESSFRNATRVLMDEGLVRRVGYGKYKYAGPPVLKGFG